MKIELTEYERDCVLDVLNERLAGGVEDLRDALGITKAQAARAAAALDRVVGKLTKRVQ